MTSQKQNLSGTEAKLEGFVWSHQNIKCQNLSPPPPHPPPPEKKIAIRCWFLASGHLMSCPFQIPDQIPILNFYKIYVFVTSFRTISSHTSKIFFVYFSKHGAYSKNEPVHVEGITIAHFLIY